MRKTICICMALTCLVSLISGQEAAVDTTHKEAKPFDSIKFRKLSTMCLAQSGSILAADEQAKEIKIISPKGKLLGTIKTDFQPQGMVVAEDGTLYCGGEGTLAIYSRKGKLLKKIDLPSDQPQGGNQMRRRSSKGNRVSGLAVSKTDVFVCIGSGWSTRSVSKLYRFDRQLKGSKLLIDSLKGCCQRCDLAYFNGKLYIAENAAHRVVVTDREGKILKKWGMRARTGNDGFGSCCNPMNIDFDSKGNLYTSEAGLGRVKKYSPDGKLLDVIGFVGTHRFTKAGGLAASCSNMAFVFIEKSSTFFVMDYKNKLIRIMEKSK